jgi:branched-chain amino acid transport system permease protein
MLQFLANGLCTGSVYALVAVGFALIYSTTSVFHFAHGAVYVIASYACYSFFILLHLPLPIAIILSIIISAIAGILIEIIVYRPLRQRGASSVVSMLSSIGVFIILINTIALFFGNQTQVLRSGVEETFSIGQVILTQGQIAQLIISSIVILIYLVFLKRNPLGRTCRAVADNSVLSSVLGINVEKINVISFLLGSCFAGLGSTLSALDTGTDPYVGFPVVLVSAIACIIGGLKNLIAPVFGGLILGVIQSLSVSVISASWQGAITYAVLIGILLFRPRGIVDFVRRAEEK